MKRSRSFLPWLALALSIPFTCIVMALFWSWTYTANVLRAARFEGTFASAEDGMRALIARGYIHPDRIQIVYAGTNSFDGSSPHVWYVIACVWGGTRADGSPVGSQRHEDDQPGTFFLNTRDGWVHVAEGFFPEFVGFLMKVYGLAAPGSAKPTHDWGSTPTQGCIF